jgi:hypothetical protein
VIIHVRTAQGKPTRIRVSDVATQVEPSRAWLMSTARPADA